MSCTNIPKPACYPPLFFSLYLFPNLFQYEENYSGNQLMEEEESGNWLID